MKQTPDIIVKSHGETANGFLLSNVDFQGIVSSDIEARYGRGSFIYTLNNQGLQPELKPSDSCKVSNDDIIKEIKNHHQIL